MKLLTVSAVVLIALVALAWVGYRLLLPRAFVAAGRGALGDARLVQLAGSRSARPTPRRRHAGSTHMPPTRPASARVRSSSP